MAPMTSLANIHFNIADYVGRFSYFGIYLWFAIFEQFTPIPEEVSLTSVGYLAVRTHLSYLFCGIASPAGLLSTDIFLF
jgi:membrane protein DedA with SNARE-associated domain